MNNSYKLKSPFQVTITVLSYILLVFIYFEFILLNGRPMNGAYKLFLHKLTVLIIL